MRNPRSGFTLIELMIVVVIIGILAAMAIPRFQVTASKAKEKEADILLKNVYTMQKAYKSAKGEYAATADQLIQIGFEQPQEAGLEYYTWTTNQNVNIDPALCLATNPPGAAWKGRKIDSEGVLNDC